jgi:O-antigen ligase
VMIDTFEPTGRGKSISKNQMLFISTVLVFASSFFVEFEPAPFDIIFLLYLMVFLYLSRTVVRRPLVSALYLVSTFALVRVFSLLFASDLAASLRFFGITTYLSFSAWFFALLVANRDPSLLKAVFIGLYVGAAITVVTVLLGMAGVAPIADIVLAYGGTRAEGFFKDPNVMGPAVIPVGLYALKQLLKGFSWLHALMLASACLLIALSFSRGAVLTFGIALVAFVGIEVWLGGARALKRIAILFLGGGVALGMGGIAILNSKFAYVLQAGQRSTAYDSDRFYVHEMLIERIGEHPFGAGPGEANAFVQGYLAVEGSNAAHNTYLRVAFENGWIGALAYFGIALFTLFVALRMIRRRQNQEHVAVAICTFLATLVSGVAVDTLHWRHSWWMAGIIWGLAALHSRVSGGRGVATTSGECK